MRRKDRSQYGSTFEERKVFRATDRWLAQVHITPSFLSDTDIPTEFLIAQKEAEALLRNFAHHLTNAQSYQLVQFLKRLRVRKKREVMSIDTAYAVLNIASKVNRKLFAENRQREKAKQDKPLANKG
jgi:hypothetical protein